MATSISKRLHCLSMTDDLRGDWIFIRRTAFLLADEAMGKLATAQECLGDQVRRRDLMAEVAVLAQLSLAWTALGENGDDLPPTNEGTWNDHYFGR